MHEYIEQRDGGYYVAGTRISLDSVVYAFNRGDSPERIVEEFPLLDRVSRVYGAIAFYLDHKAEIDKYLEKQNANSRPAALPFDRPIPCFGRRSSVPEPRWASPVLEHSLSGGRRSQL